MTLKYATIKRIAEDIDDDNDVTDNKKSISSVHDLYHVNKAIMFEEGICHPYEHNIYLLKNKIFALYELKVNVKKLKYLNPMIDNDINEAIMAYENDLRDAFHKFSEVLLSY